MMTNFIFSNAKMMRRINKIFCFLLLAFLLPQTILSQEATECCHVELMEGKQVKENMTVLTTASVEQKNGRYAWLLTPQNDGANRLRCCIKDNVLYNPAAGTKLLVEVSYLDKGYGGFCLDYNSKSKAHNGEFVQCEGSNAWKQHMFVLDDAAIDNGIDYSDFLISVNDRELMGVSSDTVCISSVRVLKSKYQSPYEITTSTGHFGNVFFKGDRISFGLKFTDRRGLDEEHPVTCTVLDYDGNKVAEQHITTQSGDVTLSNLPFGVYELKVSIADDQIKQDKVIDFSYSLKAASSNMRFGTNVHFDWNAYDDEAIKGIADLVKNAGYGFVRTSHRWNEMETVKGQYKLTHNIEYANSYLSSIGIRMLAIITQENPLYDQYPYWLQSVDKRKAYADYCSFLVNALKKYTHYFCSPSELNRYNGQYRQDNYTDFFNIVKDAYPAIKKADPNAYIVSGGLAGYQKEYNQHLFDLGILNYCNAYSMNIYEHVAGPETWYSNYPELDIYSNTMNFNREVKQADPKQEAWISETGWTTRLTNANEKLTRKQLPWCISEKDQARWYARSFMVNSDPNQIDKVFHYSFVNNYVGYFDPEDNYGIIHSHNYRTPFSAKPAYITTAAFNSIVGEARYLGDFADGDVSVNKDHYAFMFLRKDKKRVMCYWQKDQGMLIDQSPKEYTYNCNSPYLEIYDMYGNCKTVDNSRHEYKGIFSEEPVYIMGVDSPTGIVSPVCDTKKDGMIYNLVGQVVGSSDIRSSIAPGIYICDHKKILIR